MPAPTPSDVRFFPTPADFRSWLAANHTTAAELWVGYYKKGSGRLSITWPESVDQALCFGWIDGVRKSLDGESYAIRFTPRRAGSTWSEVNTKRAFELIDQGLMQPAGLAAFSVRDEDKTAAQYSYEARRQPLDPAYEAEFRADAVAWDYWQVQPAHYRHGATHWVMSAKREETRRKRLATLVADSAAGRWIALYRR